MTVLTSDSPAVGVKTGEIEAALLETLAYFDVFDYPARAEELRRYLHGYVVTPAALDEGLRSSLVRKRIECEHGYFFLAGRRQIRLFREARKARYALMATRIATYGRILGSLPFMRMVALTGSTAMQNGDDTADLDFLLVTAPGRLWLARAFAIVLGRLTALSGNILCPNVIISEGALMWPQQDIYTAHEMAQMRPLAGTMTYDTLREMNAWVLDLLPNASGSPSLPLPPNTPPTFRRWMERPLKGKIGDALENWEMRRKIARLSEQAASGAEIMFSADVCQGNFHEHGLLTRQAFQRRLAALGLEPGLRRG
jgi:hypothetical protein